MARKKWGKEKILGLAMLGIFLVGKGFRLGGDSLLGWLLVLPGALVLFVVVWGLFEDYNDAELRMFEENHVQRQCVCCGRWLPADTEHFYPLQTSPRTLSVKCIDCVINNKHGVSYGKE